MAEIFDFNTTDDSNTAAVPDGAPESMAYSAVNNVMRAIMGKLARWYWDISSVTTAGTATAYTITPNRTFASLTAGDSFRIKAHVDNTGACTFKVGSLSAVSIKTARGRDPQPGLIKNNGVYDLCYNGTNFILVGLNNTHDLAVTFNGVFPDSANEGWGYSAVARTSGGSAAGDFTVTSSVAWTDSDTARRAVMRSLTQETLTTGFIGLFALELTGTNTIRIRVTSTDGTHTNPSNMTLTLNIP